MANGLLLQPAVSVALSLAAFALMIWPGYAVLHLLGLGRHRWCSAQFAGPAVTLALWIIVLSGAAWMSIPLSRTICRIAWVATILLGGIGLALRISAAREIKTINIRDRRQTVFLWSIITLLPLASMPTIFQFGLGIFANSTLPDTWSYVAVADYLTAVARGTEGGLSPLHQYASHLMDMRNASSALLAYLAAGIGARADEAMAPFCLLLLFANAAALAAFALTVFKRTEQIAFFVFVSCFGFPALIAYFGNFDQLLLLPFLPLTAALAFRAGSGISTVGSSITIGILIASAALAYIEMALLGLLVAASFVFAPGIGLPRAMRRVAIVVFLSAALAITLSWPAISPLVRVLKYQYSAAGESVRPGDGILGTWLLRGEFVRIPWIEVPLSIIGMLVVLTAAGIWLERKRWSVVLAFATVAALSFHFVLNERYLYAAYKIVSINFWMISFFTVVGTGALADWIKQRLSPSFRVGAIALALLAALTTIGFVVGIADVKFSANAVQQQRYREALTVSSMVGQVPTLVSVRDNFANEWAIFYLSNVPMLVDPYRLYMAQPHVVPYMNRAAPVDRSDVGFIVTDRDDNLRTTVVHALRVWDGQIYSVWKTEGRDWTVTPDRGIHDETTQLNSHLSLVGTVQ